MAENKAAVLMAWPDNCFHCKLHYRLESDSVFHKEVRYYCAVT